MKKLIHIGTRSSFLALAQARETRKRICQFAPHLFSEERLKITTFITKGDKFKNQSFNSLGGKGIFTKEIDNALLGNSIDIAVHSMKDLPTVLPKKIVIGAILPREDHRDAFISFKYNHFREMPPQSLIGSASLRRRAMILKNYPNLKVVTLRLKISYKFQ